MFLWIPPNLVLCICRCVYATYVYLLPVLLIKLICHIFLVPTALAYACIKGFIPKYLHKFFLKDNSAVIQGNYET